MISNWRNYNINPNQKPKWKTTKIDHVLDLPARGGHSLVSSVPMRDQRIVEHTLNSVIDI